MMIIKWNWDGWGWGGVRLGAYYKKDFDII